jgi:tRNA 2-selenouridine synthase
MTPPLTRTTFPLSQTYSEIIDVRSPREFAEDHLPGATNLPVLDNAERAKVGTIYHQVSPFEARKVGASLVSVNISRHLQQHFQGKDKDYTPLVYCWRGGQRSNSMATVLSQIGWQVTLLEGGYKTYRHYVRAQLAELPAQFNLIILRGLTGTAKTYLLHQLAQWGEQVLDLEALANHRGSLLGQEWQDQLEPQPSQKYFESLLLQCLQQLDPGQPVWVESESNKIGQIHLPAQLWNQMKQAPCVEVQLPETVRVQWLLQEYSHLVENPELLKGKLAHLKSRHGHKKLAEWNQLVDRQQWHNLVAALLNSHYDPAYTRSMNHTFQDATVMVPITDLSKGKVDVAVQKLIKAKQVIVPKSNLSELL